MTTCSPRCWTPSPTATTQWLTGGLDAVYDGLGPRDFLRGRRVSVNGTEGTAELIDREGRLRIAVGHGESVTVESGEVYVTSDWADP